METLGFRGGVAGVGSTAGRVGEASRASLVSGAGAAFGDLSLRSTAGSDGSLLDLGRCSRATRSSSFFSSFSLEARPLRVRERREDAD